MVPIVSTSDEASSQRPEMAPRGLDSLMIQRATSVHLPYLRRLKEQVMADRYRPAPDEEGFAKWREVYCTDEYFNNIIANPDALLLCIGTQRDPVGMVMLLRTDDHLEIDDLLVLTPRQGDGTRLLIAALRYAEAWRSTDVHIDVYPGHEDVEEFLKDHGFTLEGDSQNDLGRRMLRYERAMNV
ncbi:MAG: GNAT family N-acetyltransferase [Gaiellales bacterium]